MYYSTLGHIYRDSCAVASCDENVSHDPEHTVNDYRTLHTVRATQSSSHLPTHAGERSRNAFDNWVLPPDITDPVNGSRKSFLFPAPHHIKRGRLPEAVHISRYTKA